MATTKDIFIRLAKYIAGDETGCAPPPSEHLIMSCLIAEFDGHYYRLFRKIVAQMGDNTCHMCNDIHCRNSNRCSMCYTIIKNYFEYPICFPICPDNKWSRIVVTYVWLQRTQPHTNDCLSSIANVICPWIDKHLKNWDTFKDYVKYELDDTLRNLDNVYNVSLLEQIICEMRVPEPPSLECPICFNAICKSQQTLVTLQCKTTFHASCLTKWCNCEPGDTIIATQSKCPVCLEDLYGIVSNCIDISKFNFNTHTYTKCILCYDIFSVEVDQRCMDTVDAYNGDVVCQPCYYKQNVDSILPKQLFKCPNCSAQHEFAGGCQMLTCCLYGTDKCKRDLCDHGSSNYMKFCGHQWRYKRVHKKKRSCNII
jgi:hypothetical protein